MNNRKWLGLLIILLILLPLNVCAESLRVVIQGTGSGVVTGENLICPNVCEQEYRLGSTIALKANPSSDSRFLGRQIDGKPYHAGLAAILTIDHDLVVTAIFEQRTECDDFTVYWYNGSVKQEAMIAPDEMVVFLKDRKEWRDADIHAVIDEICKRFHPDAEVSNPTDITERGGTLMILKCPQPLELKRWFNALTSLKEIEFVEFAGPMLYTDIEKRRDSMLPIGEIIVRFPENYAEEQIHAIEQEYHLIRKQVLLLGSETSYYYFAGEPLESINIANRLYESGKVESASPNMAVSYAPSLI